MLFVLCRSFFFWYNSNILWICIIQQCGELYYCIW